MKLMEEGYKVIGTKKDGPSVKIRGRVIEFDIRVETPKGVLWWKQSRTTIVDSVKCGASQCVQTTQPAGSTYTRPNHSQDDSLHGGTVCR